MPIRLHTHTHTHTHLHTHTHTRTHIHTYIDVYLSGSGINYYCVALSVHSPTTNLNATANTRVHYAHKSQSHTFEIAILPPAHGPRVHILYIMCVIILLSCSRTECAENVFWHSQPLWCDNSIIFPSPHGRLCVETDFWVRRDFRPLHNFNILWYYSNLVVTSWSRVDSSSLFSAAQFSNYRINYIFKNFHRF